MASAEQVSANQSSRRNVTIEITNLTGGYCLINPKVFLDSGETHVPPRPTVRSGLTEVCNFTKTSAKASGAVGVLTYDLLNIKQRRFSQYLAIMFSIPYDNNTYKNWFGFGIYSCEKDGKELFKEMYYNKEQIGFKREEACGGSLTFEGDYLDIKGGMSPLGRAIMKVEIWDKLFSPPRGQFH